jgi:pilus assembly protein CpaB
MSNVIKIALLFVLALLVALIVRVAVTSASQAPKPAVVTERVRVSAADLPQGLLLRDDDLAWKALPANSVPSHAVVEGARDALQLKGALLRHPVPAGTVLVSDDVILPGDPGFLAATLKPGMRAISVAVDDVSGNAGLIQPGDYVDVLLTQQLDRKTESPGYSVSSETVVEHVRVLASGSEIVRPKSSGSATDFGNRVRTVTLEVTPHMGEVVSVAAHLGSLSLALRAFATEHPDPASAAPGPLTQTVADAPPEARRGPSAEQGASAPGSAGDVRPVWAGDISRALRQLPSVNPSPVSTAGTGPAPTAAGVTVYRGAEHGDAGGAPVAQSGAGLPTTATLPAPLPGIAPLPR